MTNGSSKVADMVNDGETEAARKLKGAMLLQGVCSKKRNMLILSSPLKRSVLKGEHVNKGNVLTHRGTVKGVNGGNKAPKPTFDKWKYQAAHVKDSGIKQLSSEFIETSSTRFFVSFETKTIPFIYGKFVGHFGYNHLKVVDPIGSSGSLAFFFIIMILISQLFFKVIC